MIPCATNTAAFYLTSSYPMLHRLGISLRQKATKCISLIWKVNIPLVLPPFHCSPQPSTIFLIFCPDFKFIIWRRVSLIYAALLLLEAELILVIFSTVYVWKQRVLIAVSTSSPGFDFKYHFPHLYQFCDISDKNVQPGRS